MILSIQFVIIKCPLNNFNFDILDEVSNEINKVINLSNNDETTRITSGVLLFLKLSVEQFCCII